MSGPTPVALVGYGYWGVNLARNINSAESTTLVAVADPDPARVAAATAAYPGISGHSDLAGVLADDRVAAVVLATPVATHASFALQVMRAGRHVLVEKPLAVTSRDAREVAMVADELGLIAMVGHTFLYSPAVQHLQRTVDSGDLGALQYLYSQRLSLGKIRRDCNALWNLAPHDVSILLHLLGETPTSVSAQGFSFIEPGIDDVCFATLRFPSGVGANLHVSWIDPRKTRLLTIVGDRKMAIFNDVAVDQKVWIVDAGVARQNGNLGEYESFGEFQWRTREGDILIPRVPMTEPLLVELDAFGRACTTGVAPLTNAWHGVSVVQVLEAIDQSTRKGGEPVEVDQ